MRAIAASKAKKLRDGGGLWLVTKGNGRYWVLDYRYDGKRREMGLGPLHSVTLAEARAKAEGARALVRQGIDPIEHRSGMEAIEAARAVEGNETFGDYADAFIADAVKSGRWRGKKTEARWRNLMTRHAAPIREKALADISVTDVCQSALKFTPSSAPNIDPLVCGAGEPLELVRVAETVRPRVL